MKPFTYHTHSTYCDGKNTLAEMAEAAHRLGLDSLGFSCHSYLFNDYGCIQPESIEAYRSEVNALREQYRPLGLDIFLGIEQDACSKKIEDNCYDYVIGSVHNIIVNGDRIVIDGRNSFPTNLQKHFAGDAVALAVEYYKAVERLYELTECRIVGHIDLVTKFNEGYCLFDERDPKYENAALSAIEKLAEKGLIFEINTGSVARGYRTEPYPSKRLLSMIREAGGSVTYSSDCHDADFLTYGFESTQRLARECGFDCFMKLRRTADGCEFYPEEIEVSK